MAVTQIQPFGVGSGNSFADRQSGQTAARGGADGKGGGESSHLVVPGSERTSTARAVTERDTESQAGYSMERKDLLPLAVKIRKDPTMAVETLKQLINSDLLQTAKSGGYTELYSELESLTSKLYLTKDGIMNEIAAQEKETTMFSGHKLFDLLRAAVKQGGTGANPMSEEGRNAVGNFLKAVNFALNKDEILMALTSNLKFLSGYFSPSRELSVVLSELATRWEQLMEFSKTGVLPDAAKNSQNPQNPQNSQNLQNPQNSQNLQNPQNLQNFGSAQGRELPQYMRNLPGGQIFAGGNAFQNSAGTPINSSINSSGTSVDTLTQFKNMLDSVRDDTADIMKIITGSLLASEKTHVLAPLIVHNMSLFNTNVFLLRDAFSALLQYIPNSILRSEIVSAFDDYVNRVITPKQEGGGKNGVIVQQTGEFGNSDKAETSLASANAGNAAKSDGIAALLMNKLTMLFAGEYAKPAQGLMPGQAGQTLQSGQAGQLQQPQNVQIDPRTGEPLPGQLPQTGQAGQTAQAGQPQVAADGTRAWVNHAESPKIPAPPDAFANNPANFSKQLAAPITAEESRAFFGSLNEHTIGRTYQDYLMGNMSGKEVVAQVMQRIVQDPTQFSVIRGELDKIDSIAKLMNYITESVSLMPDTPVRTKLEEMFEGLLSDMAWRAQRAEEKGLPLKPGELPMRAPAQAEAENPEEQLAQNQKNMRGADSQSELLKNQQSELQRGGQKSSLGELTDFIQKNISHSALRTINSFNASNLLQSLINAPGVFTPLTHLIVPLQYDDTRAFGELWIDNDAGGKSKGGAVSSVKRYHIFLTFDIETIGRFEVDMYSADEDVSLALLYPEGYGDGGPSGGKRVESLRTRIDAFISRAGYKTREIQSGVLREPHSLSQIFPKINEHRRGFETVV